MSDIQPKDTVKTEFKPEDFQKEYQSLCTKMGMMIVPSLVYIARDDGTWSSKVNLSVGKLPQLDK